MSRKRAQHLPAPHPPRTLSKKLRQLGVPTKEMIPGLIKDLTSQNKVVRLDAVETLSELGNEATSAIPSLINMLHDKDPLVRETTALALAGFGAKATPAVPELIKLLGDQNRRVREGASVALENIREGRGRSTDAGFKKRGGA